jgi:hypothetical protein
MEAGFAFGGERNIAKTIRAVPFGEVMTRLKNQINQTKSGNGGLIDSK